MAVLDSRPFLGLDSIPAPYRNGQFVIGLKIDGRGANPAASSWLNRSSAWMNLCARVRYV